jgi:hypothetical protein
MTISQTIPSIANFTPASSALSASATKSGVLTQLEHTRSAFHELINSVDESALRLKSTESKRSLHAVLAHIVMSMEMTYPMFVSRAQAGEKLSMPAYFATSFGHWLSYILSEQRAKKSTIQSLHAGYDAAHTKLVALINGLSAEAFDLTTTLPKPRSEIISIEQFLRIEIPAHFSLHEREVQRTLRS